MAAGFVTLYLQISSICSHCLYLRRLVVRELRSLVLVHGVFDASI